MAIGFSTSVSELSGVGAQRAQRLQKLGISTFGDLIHYYPRAYERRGDLKTIADAPVGETCAMLLTVATEVTTARIRGDLSISKFRCFDETGSVEVVFFNAPFVKNVFHVGSVFRFYGKLALQKRHLQLLSPKYEPHVEGVPMPDLVPIYPLTERISSKQLAAWIAEVQAVLLPLLSDPLPERVRLAIGLPTLRVAVHDAHFPANDAALSQALRRLAFDEMFFFALKIAGAASAKKNQRGVTVAPCSVVDYLKLLPYELTRAQKNAVNEIYRDLTHSDPNDLTPPMTRILVGDVGSGKTVCAALAAYIVMQSDLQVALMAPTEILARQHYLELSEHFSKLGYRTALLLGSTKKSEKNTIYEGLRCGEIRLVIGTHALLSEKVQFADLGLIITDEQHRFGVAQRAVLKDRSRAAHLLVMSATPIPRTLALAMYGDLDVSRIDELPRGRMPVETYVVDESYRARLNGFIQKQVASGGQVYVVCPSIEPEETAENAYAPTGLGCGDMIADRSVYLKNAVEYAETLKQSCPSLSIDILHGRMRDKEKDAIMQRFVAGETSVLVSTTVIEVGVNVPNACLMIVENAERFGLSQLHQLRGRVGRGTRRSYCILVSDTESETSRARLDALKDTTDGYAIAEFDLKMRGPGDFFSSQTGENIRQSGGVSVRFASICNDTELFSKAFSFAKDIIANDPTLSAPENCGLREALADALSCSTSSIS